MNSQSRKGRFLILPVMALAVAVLIPVGCNVDSPTDNNLVVSPDRVELRFGESQEFFVTGGFFYTWSLANDDWGELSSSTGERVVYTSQYDPGAETETVRQVLTVRSTLEDEADVTSTNDLSIVHTREIYITHRTEAVDVSISPATVRLQEFESQAFTASGARTYTWSLAEEAWGTLTARSGPTTTYTSRYSPSADEAFQVLYCDTDEGRFTAHIIHDLPELIVRPSSASLSLDQSVVLTATGPGAVTWSISGVGTPYVTNTPSGNTFEIQMITDFDDLLNPESITVTASSGDQTAQATVSLYGSL